MKNTWVLIGNSNEALIYNWDNSDKLKIINHFNHLELRLERKEDDSENEGRELEQFLQREHPLSPHQAVEKFAKELAGFLEQARLSNKFDNLVLSASPKFLGKLKKNISRKTTRKIIKNIDKDLRRFSKEKILREIS